MWRIPFISVPSGTKNPPSPDGRRSFIYARYRPGRGGVKPLGESVETSQPVTIPCHLPGRRDVSGRRRRSDRPLPWGGATPVFAKRRGKNGWLGVDGLLADLDRRRGMPFEETSRRCGFGAVVVNGLGTSLPIWRRCPAGPLGIAGTAGTRRISLSRPCCPCCPCLQLCATQAPTPDWSRAAGPLRPSCAGRACEWGRC